MVGWKKGFFKRLINLTDDNAKLLAQQLDRKKIGYTWDEHRRKAWEERVNRSELNGTPE